MGTRKSSGQLARLSKLLVQGSLLVVVVGTTDPNLSHTHRMNTRTRSAQGCNCPEVDNPKQASNK